MTYKSFNLKKVDATKEPMFFGESVNIARYDVQHYPIFESLINKQLSFFWRPEEVDLTQDRIDFQKLPEHEQHIFISNLKYQTLLDSVQGRSPNVAFLPLVSIPELETWIETWAFSETIHSRSYTHILRNIFNEPSEVFDSIMDNEHILKRAGSVTKYYDDLIEYTNHVAVSDGYDDDLNSKEHKRLLYLCMVAVNVLEAIRFYVSFACSFAFAERGVMEGNAKIIKLIARDEALHLTGTQHILKLFEDGIDPEMQQIAAESGPDVIKIFMEAANEEKQWAEYLFKDGSMIGMNKEILNQYIEYITDQRLKAIGYLPVYQRADNPLPWMNTWLNSDTVQVAPQETEISSYLVGQVDSNVDSSTFSDFEL